MFRRCSGKIHCALRQKRCPLEIGRIHQSIEQMQSPRTIHNIGCQRTQVPGGCQERIGIHPIPFRESNPYYLITDLTDNLGKMRCGLILYSQRESTKRGMSTLRNWRAIGSDKNNLFLKESCKELVSSLVTPIVVTTVMGTAAF